MSRIYLYGIIESGDDANLGFLGVGGASPVYEVVYEGLGCVVSGYDGDDLAAAPKEELFRCLLAHQQVLERVMLDHSVLPVKFGTVLNNVLELFALLSQGRSTFAEALVSIRDKVEVEVAATWNKGRILEEIGSADDVVRAREAILSKGRPTVEDRVRLGQMVKSLMDQRRGAYRERTMSYISPHCADIAPNALLSDEMVMNVAFLVDRARLAQFTDALERLDDFFRNEITFRVIGPLPPYSFSTVEVVHFSGEQVEAARRTLGLAHVSSEDAVRKAYRRLAAKRVRAQRTENGGPEQTKIGALRDASDLLLRYCRARQEVLAGDGRDGPAYRGIDNLFSIALARSRSDEVESARFGAAAPLSAGAL